MELLIGPVAKRFGVTVNAIRNYEQRGLIGPLPRRGTSHASRGYRIFSERDLYRLEFIRQARSLDLSLKQINELLEAVDQGCCSSVRPNLKELLEAKLRETEERMQGLRRFHQKLKRLHQRATEMVPPSGTGSLCSPEATPSQCVFGIERRLTKDKGGKEHWQRTG